MDRRADRLGCGLSLGKQPAFPTRAPGGDSGDGGRRGVGRDGGRAEGGGMGGRRPRQGGMRAGTRTVRSVPARHVIPPPGQAVSVLGGGLANKGTPRCDGRPMGASITGSTALVGRAALAGRRCLGGAVDRGGAQGVAKSTGMVPSAAAATLSTHCVRPTNSVRPCGGDRRHKECAGPTPPYQPPGPKGTTKRGQQLPAVTWPANPHGKTRDFRRRRTPRRGPRGQVEARGLVAPLVGRQRAEPRPA